MVSCHRALDTTIYKCGQGWVSTSLFHQVETFNAAFLWMRMNVFVKWEHRGWSGLLKEDVRPHNNYQSILNSEFSYVIWLWPNMFQLMLTFRRSETIRWIPYNMMVPYFLQFYHTMHRFIEFFNHSIRYFFWRKTLFSLWAETIITRVIIICR